MNQNSNPYATPAANVGTPNQPDESLHLLAEPRAVLGASVISWLKSGWSLVKPDLGIWVLIVLTLLAMNVVAGLIPIAGPFLVTLFIPVLLGGLLMGTHAVYQGSRMNFESLFAGFQKNFSVLVVLGLVNLLAYFVLMSVFLTVVGVTAMVVGSKGPPPTGLENFMIMAALALFGLILAFLCTVVPLFATPLVALNNLQLGAALKLSLKALKRNVWPLFVFYLLAFLLILLGMLPFLLGLFIVMPVLVVAIYQGYRAIFLK
jgi:uncharacterized membrane protein